jgi:hypothetical protein
MDPPPETWATLARGVARSLARRRGNGPLGGAADQRGVTAFLGSPLHKTCSGGGLSGFLPPPLSPPGTLGAPVSLVIRLPLLYLLAQAGHGAGAHDDGRAGAWPPAVQQARRDAHPCVPAREVSFQAPQPCRDGLCCRMLVQAGFTSGQAPGSGVFGTVRGRFAVTVTVQRYARLCQALLSLAGSSAGQQCPTVIV